MLNTKICFIGSGNMARSLIGGLIADGCGQSLICAADPNPQQRAALVEQFGIRTFADNNQAAAGADVIVIAVKPQVMRTVATGLADVVTKRKNLIISIAAGIRIPDLVRWLGGSAAVVRAMPNTPALLGCGVSGLYANAATTNPQREVAESVLRAVGAAIWLDDEALMDAVTAVSGSGPAYFFLFMEMIEATARDIGLPAGTARLLTVETALGAARMALETSDDLARLRQQVTSPGGTTAAALSVLDATAMRQLVDTAIKRARDRGVELADEFGRDS